MRILALDLGARRIGVAASDPLGMTAQPIETIEVDGSELKRIEAIAGELGCTAVVVGLPLLMDGTEGTQARAARLFASRLQEELGLESELFDERLTSREAEAVLAGEKLGREERREAGDRIAAALILKGFLEAEGSSRQG